MSKSFNALVVEAGGFEKLPFIEKDARNYIDKARHLRLGKGGADALRGYFERMQYKNDGYGMPFAPFVGVNHHGQSILLGAGLISSENTETFVWLFDTWLKCMDGRAPKAIITDQDRAMKNAIAITFPNTRHRYCLWHTMRKLPEKLGSHAEFKCGLKSALQRCVYDSLTSDEFEKSYEVFIDTYKLHENVWLQSLYSERTYWVPVYLKNTFWAGMSTTQMSESMNAFFDGYVHLGTTFKEFVDQFDNALRKKVENEMTADFYSFNFNDQKEVENGIKKSTLQAYFNEEECEAKCMCGLFEMRGIIYRHILSIFAARDVQELPEKYIMESSYDDLSGKPAASRYSGLIKLCYEVATNACESEDNSLDMTDKLKAMNSIYNKSKPQATVASTHTSIYAETGSSKKVLSPHVVRGKGRPPSKRRQPTIEKLQTKNKKAGSKRQRKSATSHTKDVLNPTDEVILHGTPQGVSQIPATQQSVISQDRNVHEITNRKVLT
ncbi:protein FAR1-RELATED SEQUENCE 5-like [Carya illinoinensis]|uniref:protein FAR1-RELATED SEQUENCE 5-like n=1 Tax=Carya illinoinensis TaxID=32201 RepID=UPI001C721E97|nr:protein FAR1-RELATED SEQUENCE 5-like [Carya illinoinensis]